MARKDSGTTPARLVLHGFTPLDDAALRAALSAQCGPASSWKAPCVILRVDAANVSTITETANAVRLEQTGAVVLVIDSGVGRAAAQVARGCGATYLTASTSLTQLAALVLGGTPAKSPSNAGVERRQVTGLTAREIQVLQLIRNGDSNEGIARRLGISPNTARGHVHRVLSKLGVGDRLAAARVAREASLPLWQDSA